MKMSMVAVTSTESASCTMDKNSDPFLHIRRPYMHMHVYTYMYKASPPQWLTDGLHCSTHAPPVLGAALTPAEGRE